MFTQQASLFSGRCIFITVDVSQAGAGGDNDEFTQNLLTDLSISVPGRGLGAEAEAGSAGREKESELGGEGGDTGTGISTLPHLMIIKSARTRMEFYHLADAHTLLGGGGGGEVVVSARIHDFLQQFFSKELAPDRVIEVPAM